LGIETKDDSSINELQKCSKKDCAAWNEIACPLGEELWDFLERAFELGEVFSPGILQYFHIVREKYFEYLRTTVKTEHGFPELPASWLHQS
jgi:hypothetical protein